KNEDEFTNESDAKFNSENESDTEFNSENESDIKSNSENKGEIEKEDTSRFNKREAADIYYVTKKDILNTAQGIAQYLGFAITIKSDDTCQRKRMSKCCGCPFLLKAAPKKFKWCVIEILNEHNHSIAKDKRKFHEHRQLTREARKVVLIDATYKTNVYKLPFVNFVDIGNLGINKLETFGIAGAWISNKSENLYT
ncbi:12680_t:CDS:2, partial [Cetraspora pellucida]